MDQNLVRLTDNDWQNMVNRAFDSLPEPHRSSVQNVAIVLENLPSEEERERVNLRDNQTLLGLYTGVPLTERQGRVDLPPDVISLYKIPLINNSSNVDELYENIRHTLWHEVAHYFGLDHTDISKLE